MIGTAESGSMFLIGWCVSDALMSTVISCSEYDKPGHWHTTASLNWHLPVQKCAVRTLWLV